MQNVKNKPHHKHSFFEFFPVPKFLEMPAPGLSLSETGVRMVEFARSKNSYTLQSYGEFIFTEPFIRAGLIHNKEGLIEVLSKFKKDYNLHYIRASLPEERAYVFSTDVFGEPGENLRGAIESVIEENVPLSVGECIFDYSTLASTEKDGRNITKVSVSAISQDVVFEYLDVLRACGLEPLHFDIESQAIAKAIIPRGETSVNLIVNISKNKVGIYIDAGGAISFASTTQLSSWTQSSETNGQSIAVTEILSEIKKVFSYFQTQADKKGEEVRSFENVYVVGDIPLDKPITDAISKQFGGPIIIGNVWRNIFTFSHYVPPISKEASLAYAAAAGLALPRTIQ